MPIHLSKNLKKKSDMNTKEQKAKEYAESLTGLDYMGEVEAERAYLFGWDEALKSQWVIPTDSLPKLFEKVLVMFEYEGEIQIHDYTYMGGNFVYGASKIIAWMPIPSFDKILEDNKDILKRLKDK